MRAVLLLWLFCALAVGKLQMLQSLPAPALPALVLTLAAGLLMLYRRVPSFGGWVNGLDLRSIVALHLTRFLGFYFFYLSNRGFLPPEFAIPAGIGDILTAFLAANILMWPLSASVQKRAITLWNIIGLVEIILVVISAARIAQSDFGSMDAMTRLPLSLLSTFLVPMIIASHIVIFIRLARDRA